MPSPALLVLDDARHVGLAAAEVVANRVRARVHLRILLPTGHTNGVARTADGVLAGSAILLDEAVRGWATFTDATLAQAFAAASEAPSAAIRLPPPLAEGSSADLILTDDVGTVLRVMRHGAWVE